MKLDFANQEEEEERQGKLPLMLKGSEILAKTFRRMFKLAGPPASRRSNSNSGMERICLKVRFAFLQMDDTYIRMYVIDAVIVGTSVLTYSWTANCTYTIIMCMARQFGVVIG